MSKKKTQKILIPKGTINPDEDTLIEVPYSLKSNTLVVAGPSPAADFNAKVDKTTSFYDPSPISKSYIRLPEEARSSKTVYYKQPNDYSQILSPILRNDAASSSKPTSDLDDMVLPDLYAAEQEERSVMEEKLSAYQQARRQFLFESTRVASKSFQTPSYMDNSRRHQETGTDESYAMRGSSRSIKARPSKNRSEFKRSRRGNLMNDEDDNNDEEDDSCFCSSKANSL